jgi:hypothetical protein
MKQPFALLVLLSVPVVAVAQGPAQIAASIAQRTAGIERRDGFLPFYWDAARGRVLLEVPRLGEDILYFVGVAKGIGSVDLGVDRGSAGPVFHSDRKLRISTGLLHLSANGGFSSTLY